MTATVPQPAVRLAVVSLSALLIGLLAGCRLSPPDQPEASEPSPSECGRLQQASAEGATADLEVYLLVDRTDSTRAASGAAGAARSFAGVLVEPLRSAVDGGAVVSVGGFDGSQSSVKWTASQTVTRSSSENQGRAGQDRERSVACLTGDLARAARETPSNRGTDVLGALAAAAERLQQSSAPRREVVIATDGLANVGCANLNERVPGDQDDLVATVKSCQDSGELPDLGGVDVRIVGVGHPGPGHEQLSSPQLQGLKRFWTSLCEGTGASSCAVTTDLQDPGDDATEPPATAGVDDPAVTLLADVELEGEVIIVRDSLLFETDSADLTAEAQVTIEQVTDEIRRQSTTRVRVEGHADARADELYNLELSTRRAEAVRDALLQAGVTDVTAEGMGESCPRQDCGEQYRTDGTPDLRAMACNRRVEIHLALPRG